MAEEYGRTRSQTKKAREAANGADAGGSVRPSASPARLAGDFDDEADSVAGAAAAARTPRQRQPRLTAANTNRNATSGTAGGASGRSRKAVVIRQQDRPTARPGPAGTAVPAEQDEAAAPDRYAHELLEQMIIEQRREDQKQRAAQRREDEERQLVFDAREQELQRQHEAKQQERQRQLEARRQEHEAKQQEHQRQLEARRQEHEAKQQEHQRQLEARRQELEAKQQEHQRQLEARRQEHQRQLEAKQQEHQRQLEARRQEHQRQLEAKQQEHQRQLEARRQEHQRQLEARQQEHEAKQGLILERILGRLDEQQEASGELQIHQNQTDVDLRVLGPDLRTKVASFLASSSLEFSALPGTQLCKRLPTHDGPIDVDETMAIALRAQCAAQFAINRAANVDIVSFDLTSTYRAWGLPSLKTLGPVFARLVPTIESLRVNNLLYWHGDRHEKIRLLFDYLDEAFNAAPQLHSLDISGTVLWFHGHSFMPRILGGNTNVRNLNMRDCGGFDRRAAPFFLRLAESPVFASRLEGLDLSHDTLYDAEAASAICAILANASRMKKLALDWIRRCETDYRAAAMYSLARMAQRVGKTSLVDLSLSAYPMIDPVSGTCIIDHLSLVLRLSPNLREFTFSYSSGMDDESSARIIDALREGGARLRVLDLSDTGIGEVATRSLTNYIRSNLTNSLEKLCISQTQISFGDVFGDGDLIALLPALAQCTKLMVLDISDNDISEDGLRALLVHRIPSLKRLVMPNMLDEEWGLFAGASIDAELKEKIQSLYPVVVTEE